jgi:hypothetical protein
MRAATAVMERTTKNTPAAEHDASTVANAVEAATAHVRASVEAEGRLSTDLAVAEQSGAALEVVRLRRALADQQEATRIYRDVLTTCLGQQRELAQQQRIARAEALKPRHVAAVRKQFQLLSQARAVGLEINALESEATQLLGHAAAATARLRGAAFTSVAPNDSGSDRLSSWRMFVEREFDIDLAG